MSGNIHDTNINQIKTEVYNLIDDLKQLNEDPCEHEYRFKKKYKYLYNTSQSLFSFIISNWGKDEFNQNFFNKTLELMLTQIEKIQQSRISQYDASSNVGSHLATTFIPQLRENK